MADQTSTPTPADSSPRPRRKIPHILKPKNIEQLRPEEKPYEIGIPSAPGLRLRVQPTGRKIFRWKLNHLNRAIIIGPFTFSEKPGFVTLGQAGEWLRRLQDAHVGGRLDEEEVQLRKFLNRAGKAFADSEAKPAAITIATLAEEFYTEEILRARRHPSQVRLALDNDILPAIGQLSPMDVTRKVCKRVVIRAVDGIDRASAKTGRKLGAAPTYAGNVLQVLKQFFSWIEDEYEDELPDFENKAAGLKAEKLGVASNKCKRALSPEEIPLFWNGLEKIGVPRPAAPGKKACSVADCGGALFAKGLCARHYRRVERTGSTSDPKDVGATARAALRLLLMTGVRSGELRQAEWREVDFDAATWTVPVAHQKLKKSKMKDASPFVVPLAPRALDLMRELKKLAGESPYVLASPVDDGERPGAKRTFKPMDDKVLGHVMRRLFAGPEPRVKLGPDVPPTAHDLRRTMRTHLGRLRVQLHIAERCLNHSIGRIVETYDTFDYLDERREALLKWDAYVGNLLAPADAKLAFLPQAGAR